jgi:hypothetical protein
VHGGILKTTIGNSQDRQLPCTIDRTKDSYHGAQREMFLPFQLQQSEIDFQYTAIWNPVRTGSVVLYNSPQPG